MMDDFEEKNPEISYGYHRIFNAMNMFNAAATKAGSVDRTKVAMALEGLEYETAYGTLTMRADNHQILQPLYMSTFSSDVKRDVEHLGLGWTSGEGDRIEAADTSMETTCEMKRP
jgi:branched-chain amino acid transport system substrate-binding protein